MAWEAPFTNAELLLLADQYSGSGDLLDQSGNDHDATISGATFLPHSGTNYMWIPGGTPASNQDIAFTPTPGAMDFEDICTTTFDVRTRVSLPDLTPSSAVPLWLVVGASVMGIQLTPGGLLQTVFGNSAAATITHTASATLDAAGMAVDTDTIIRVRGSDLDTTTWLVDFDYSIDGGVTWTAIGAQQSQASAAGFFNGAYDRYVWGQRVATVRGEAKLIGLEMWADGTKYHDIQPTDIDASNQAAITSTLGNTWTVTRATSGYTTTLVTEPMFVLDGVDDYLEVAHHADLDADNDFTALIAYRMHDSTPAAISALISKRQNTAAAKSGWDLEVAVSGAIHAQISDGITEAIDGPGSGTDSALTVAGLHLTAGVEVEGSLNGSPSGSPTAFTVDATSTYGLRIGILGAGGNPSAIEFYAAAVWNRALSDAEIAAANTLLQAGGPNLVDFGLGDLSEADIVQLATLAGVTITSGEIVGQLNEIAGTTGSEYKKALVAAAAAAGVTYP
jgi:hypothetical protein